MTDLTSAPAKTLVSTRLSVMMFLEFFIWGAWYVSMTGFINKSEMGAVTGAAYTVGPIAAIIAPFFLGMIADRFFSTERVLAVLHLVGGLFLILAPFAASPFSLPEMPEDAGIFYKVFVHDLPAYKHPFVLCLLGHMICFMPTVGLTASLSFQNLTSQEKQFPIIRVLGTIGWIVGNWAIIMLPNKDASSAQFYVAGGAAVLLALYSLTLPHTPAPSKGKKIRAADVLGLDSLRLFKMPSYTVFIICSFLICIPLAGYYQQARNFVDATDTLIFDSATTTMSLGQVSEVFFMLVMPFFFIRLGVKWMLAIGMLAWVARYGLFAGAANDNVAMMVVLGVVLHGICYDFFFVTGMIYVDKKATADIRHQAQGFLVLVTQGLGMFIGAKAFFAFVLMMTDSETGELAWRKVWLYPCLFAAVIMVAFVLFFWDKKPGAAALDNAPAATPDEPAA